MPFESDTGFQPDKTSTFDIMKVVIPQVVSEMIKSPSRILREEVPTRLAESGHPFLAGAEATAAEILPLKPSEVVGYALAPAGGKLLGEAFAPIVGNVAEAFPKVAEFLQRPVSKLGTELLPHEMSKEQFMNFASRKIKEKFPSMAFDDSLSSAIEKTHKDLIIRAKQMQKAVPGEIMQSHGLKAELIPGSREFIEKDVMDSAKKVMGTLGQVKDYVQKLFAPTTRSPEAAVAGGIIRENAAELARKKDIAENYFKTVESVMESLPQDFKFDFIDRIETGREQTSQEFQTVAEDLRKALNESYQEVKNTGKPIGFILNYFPHIWKDVKNAEKVFGETYGRRPLGGRAAFRLKRSIPTTLDGIEKGLEPVTDNPVRLTLLRKYQMDRFVHGQKIFGEMKERGLAQLVRSGKAPPEGWIPINDKIAKVFQFVPEEKGFIQRGQYYAPGDVAQVLNNHLSPGLRQNEAFNALRVWGNTLNQAQLGLSLFHLSFTSNDAIISKTAQMAQNISRGEFGKAGVSLAKGEILSAPAQTYLKGSKVLEEWLHPGTQGEEMGAILDSLVAGGGRAKMDAFYYNSAVESFWSALRSGNPIGAVLRSPFALIEAASKPIMQDIVPKQKLGVFFGMAKNDLEYLAQEGERLRQAVDRLKGPSLRSIMGRNWDSVDNRLGQMVYDNLFWNRTLKDVLMLSVRSLGWNLGTLRELAGGVIDTEKQFYKLTHGKGDQVELTPRMVYTMMLPIVVGLEGAMYQYLHTGEGPRELKDYYFPKTGRVNSEGNPERVSLLSYMKDVFAFQDRPTQTIFNKLHPQAGMLYQMFKNEDYYGVKIRNEDDPFIKKMKDEGEFVLKQFIPFSFRNLMQRRKAGGSIGDQAESFFGITEAPRAETETEARKKIDKVLAEKVHGIRTKEQFEKSQVIKELVNKVRKGDDVSEEVNSALEEGSLTQKDADHIYSGELSTPLQDKFGKLPVSDAARIFQLMTPQEKEEVREVFLEKINNQTGNIPPDKVDEYFSILEK